MIENGREEFYGQVWVDVPLAAQVALGKITPNPSKGRFTVSLALPLSGPATLEVVDVNGRRVLSREVGGLGPGGHDIDFGRDRSLETGVYWVRLTQAGRTFSRKAVVVK
jgi:hypothetical protein